MPIYSNSTRYEAHESQGNSRAEGHSHVQTWKISDAFGIWNVASAEDSISIAGSIELYLDGIVRVHTLDSKTLPGISTMLR